MKHHKLIQHLCLFVDDGISVLPVHVACECLLSFLWEKEMLGEESVDLWAEAEEKVDDDRWAKIFGCRNVDWK